jgi:hypothetical protein
MALDDTGCLHRRFGCGVVRLETDMAIAHTVGLRLRDRSETLTIDAEDALIAALKAKHEHPEATITYVRRSNKRGDRRHPHAGLSQETKSGS